MHTLLAKKVDPATIYDAHTASKESRSCPSYFANSTSYKVVWSIYFAHRAYIMYVSRIYLLFPQCVCVCVCVRAPYMGRFGSKLTIYRAIIRLLVGR